MEATAIPGTGKTTGKRLLLQPPSGPNPGHQTDTKYQNLEASRMFCKSMEALSTTKAFGLHLFLWCFFKTDSLSGFLSSHLSTTDITYSVPIQIIIIPNKDFIRINIVSLVRPLSHISFFAIWSQKCDTRR